MIKHVAIESDMIYVL